MRNQNRWEDRIRVEKFKFRFLHDSNGKIIATVCYKPFDELHACYGIAVTSPRDNGCKEIGRQIAYGRMVKGISVGGEKPMNSKTLRNFNSPLGEYGMASVADIKSLVITAKNV